MLTLIFIEFIRRTGTKICMLENYYVCIFCCKSISVYLIDNQ